MPHDLNTIPPERRDAARAAIVAAFGSVPFSVAAVAGGASGALTFRVEAAGRPYLLRMEGARRPGRNPHQYACMQIAAEAGIAPALHHVDAEAGVAIMDFVAVRPLEEFPGGPVGLACAAAKLIARLQATPTFPHFIDYFDGVARLFGFIRGSNLFAAGLLDPHLEGFTRIRTAWRPSGAPVSAHNDPNMRNLLFDGSRLWLVDWETAYRNDPLVDIAILLDQMEATALAGSALVEAWLGHPPDALLAARLTVMRPVTRLWYACVSLARFAAMPREKPDADLSAPSPAEFRRAFVEGRLTATGPETLYILGKMQLAGFRAAVAAPGFDEALAAIAGT